MLVSNKRPPDAADDVVDLDRMLANPTAAFDEPERVVRHPQLSPEQKREILRRWALEIYRTDCAKTRATAPADFARLDKVIDALIDLDEPARALFKRRQTPTGGARAAGVRRIAINGKS